MDNEDKKQRKLTASYTFTAADDMRYVQLPVEQDPNLTDEEKTWDRLKNGIQYESIEDVLVREMATEISEEIDREVLANISKLASDES